MKRLIIALLLSFNFLSIAQETGNRMSLRSSCSQGSLISTYNIQDYNNLCQEDPWILAFEDKFDGTCLDTNKWNVAVGVPRDPFFNGQKAWHTPNNISVNNGVLKICSKRDTFINKPVVTSWDPYTFYYSDFEFSTGEIQTKQQFGYGKYEARIKIPKGKGLWPAFWTFGNTDISPWHEIDVFEFYGETETEGSNVHHMAVHRNYMGQGHKQCNYDYTGVDFSEDYHIYTVIYTKSYIKWYVDGELKQTHYRYLDLAGYYQECDLNAYQLYLQNTVFPTEAMNIILNVAIINGDNKPDMTTPFPTYMEVDWVRYYVSGSCDNEYISDTNAFYTDNSGVITGETVTLENVILQGHRQKQVVAANQILLKPEIVISGTTGFVARIDETICLDFSLNSEKKMIQNDVICDSLQYEKGEELDFSICPNPTYQTIKIIHSGNPLEEYKILIYNSSGYLIKDWRFTGAEYVFDCLLSPGVYVISLQDKYGRTLGRRKVLKK